MPGDGRIRLDKWLWQARFFKSRSLSAEAIAAGQIRLNGVQVTKPGRAVGPDDVLTFGQNAQILVVRILACGTRRGPAAEAQGLYCLRDEKDMPKPVPSAE